MTDTHTTTHIPDEAVQAAINKWHDGEYENIPEFDNMRNSITAALPYLSAPCAVEVKKLEWVSKGQRHPPAENLYAAETSFGLYMIAERQDGSHCGAYTVPNTGFNHNATNLDDAKAAAQADFERRILSCVVTKPVDVAAVRRQAFEEGFENGIEQSLNALNAYDDITRNEAEQEIRKLTPDYRALSDEPAQGEQWRDIVTVGERERLIIIGSYNAKGSWCAEVWHTKYLRDQQAKSASGFFMNAPHLEWVPTHFMELPAAPTTEAGQ